MKATILAVGKVTPNEFDGTNLVTEWVMDCRSEVPMIELFADGRETLIGGFTVEELRQIADSNERMYPSAVRNPN